MTRTEFIQHSRMATRVLATIVLAAVILVAVASGIFLALGGRFHNVETPSMGAYAPVGTLVLSMPTTVQDVHVGEMVFFTPPGGHELYFHRILAKTPEGFKSQGDLNGTPDPWVLGATNIQGHEVARILYLGWLLPVLPILIVGGIVVYVFTRFFVDRYWRLPLQVLGATLVISLANYLLRPLMRAIFISQTVVHHVATIKLVSTGILPLRVQAVNGTSAIARLGHLVVLHTKHPAKDGRFHVNVTVYLTWWEWAIAIFLLVLPFLITLVYVLIARRRGWDYYYEEVDPASVPGDVVVGESHPVVVRGRIAPLYATLEDLMAQDGLSVDTQMDTPERA